MNIRELDRIEKRLLSMLRFGIVIVTIFETPRMIANKCIAKIVQRKEAARQEQVLRKNLLFCFLGHGESPLEDNEE